MQRNIPSSRLIQLQQSLGNRTFRRLFKAGVIQAKLKIDRPGDKYEQEADRVAEWVMRMPEPRGQHSTESVASSTNDRFVPSLQRQVYGRPSVSVRSPVVEELITQVTTAEAYVETGEAQSGRRGRALTGVERSLAQAVFGNSIDYARVRLIPTGIWHLRYTTVANVIRIPEKFTIMDPVMAEWLIHEMTHIWQYQHGGTGYISEALAGAIAKGRQLVYKYEIVPGKSFFEFTPEQQASIVQNYFRMLQDRAKPRPSSGSIDVKRYLSNHRAESGKGISLSWPERQAEIRRELHLHETLIKQMRTALPQPEVDILTSRAMEVIRTPHEEILPIPEEHQLTPVKPILEIAW